MLRGLAVFSLLPAALALAGCSDQACIQWSEAEGACPAGDVAREYMGAGGSTCGKVVSVDSEGDFDGTACCYDVTERDENDFESCIPSPSVGAGVGPSAGPSVSSSSSSGGAFTPSCGGDTCDPVCYPPIESPSGGTCIGIGAAGVFCNPITNEGCVANEVCDLFIDEFGPNYLCYGNSFYFTCSTCSAWGECAQGYGCFDNCGKYCCDDADCGDLAHCDFTHVGSLGMPGGVCVNDASVGGAGGAGGQGGGGLGGAGGAGGGGASFGGGGAGF